jgi:hypothetical protein
MLSLLGDHAGAWEESKRARDIDPNLFTARSLLSEDRVATGNLDDARAIAGETIPPTPFDGEVAYALQMAGDTGRAAAIRRALDAKPDTAWLVHTARAYAYLAVGDTSRVLSELESAAEYGELAPQFNLLADRVTDGLRGSARFAAVVRKFGLDGRGLTSPRAGRPAP